MIVSRMKLRFEILIGLAKERSRVSWRNLEWCTAHKENRKIEIQLHHTAAPQENPHGKVSPSQHLVQEWNLWDLLEPIASLVPNKMIIWSLLFCPLISVSQNKCMEMLTMPTLECCLLTNYHKPSHGRGKNLTIPPSINDYIVSAQKSSPNTNFKIKLKNSRTFFCFYTALCVAVLGAIVFGVVV